MKEEKDKHTFMSDVMGGIMTAVVALPVAMAFGIASGLGAAAGLYGAMACGIFAALFGGTRGQQSGPTGPIAVIVASVMVASGNRPEVVFAATILAGVLQIVLGRVGAGQYVRYLPYPVISGFMTGIAAIIIILHINPLFGIEGSKKILDSLLEIPNIPWAFNAQALGVGLLTFALIFLFKRLSRKLPAALLALLIASGFSVLLHMDVPRIGVIPGELPMPQIPAFQLQDFKTILMGGFLIAVLGSIDSLLTSVVADKLVNSRHDSNKELVGQGIGNMVSGLIGGLAGAGSTTRTLANIDAGGRTPLSGVVYGLIIMAVILGLGRWAALIPLSSLAAILITLGIGIIDWKMMSRLRETPRSDVAIMVTVLGLTVFVDLISAVLVGTALASIIFAKKFSEHVPTIEPFAISEEWELHGRHLPEAVTDSTVLVSFLGPLFFAQGRRLHDALPRLLESRHVIMQFAHTPFADQSFSYQLEDTVGELQKHGVDVLMVGLDTNITALLRGLDCKQSVAPHRQFDTMEEALRHLSERPALPQTA